MGNLFGLRNFMERLQSFEVCFVLRQWVANYTWSGFGKIESTLKTEAYSSALGMEAKCLALRTARRR